MKTFCLQIDTIVGNAIIIDIQLLLTRKNENQKELFIPLIKDQM